MQAQWRSQISQGFAVMLQVPTAAIASITFANTSQQSATRHLMAASLSPSPAANSPAANVLAASPAAPQTASAASAVMSTASAAGTQTVAVVIHPWHAGNATNSSGLGQGPLTAPSAARLLRSTDLAQSQASFGFAVVKVAQAYRVGVCGNGVCEVGERAVNGSSGAGLLGSCPADCPAPYVQCPTNGTVACSGKGQCLTSQGSCSCYPG